MMWLWCARCLFCVWQMNRSSDEERYSRFRGECQDLTVVMENLRARDEDGRGRPRHRGIEMVAGETRFRWLRGVVRSDGSSGIGTGIGHILTRTRVWVARSSREGKATGGERSSGARGTRRTATREGERGREIYTRGAGAVRTFMEGLAWASRMGKNYQLMSSGLCEWGQRLCQLQRGMQQVVRREYPRLHRCDKYTWKTKSGHPSIVQPTQRIWGNITIPRRVNRRSLNFNLCGRAQPGHQGQFCVDPRVWRHTAIAQADDWWHGSTSNSPGGIFCDSPCEDSCISPWVIGNGSAIQHETGEEDSQPGVSPVSGWGAGSEAPCRVVSPAMVFHTGTGMLEMPGG